MLILTLGIVYIRCYESKRNDSMPLPSTPEELEAYEIEVFREYLRIPSVHPNVDYSKYRDFLEIRKNTKND